MNFVIHTPWPYTNRSAGIRALFTLQHELSLLGHSAQISTLGFHHFPPDDHPCDWCSFEIWDGTTHDEEIHVYPEIVPGNPTGAQNVVRWLLNKQRYSYPESDLCFTWDQSYANHRRLRLDLVEHDLFYDDGGERYFHTFYGFKRITPFVQGGMQTMIIDEDWPDNRKDLAILFRRSIDFTTYKAYSMLVEEAKACGCPVKYAEGVQDLGISVYDSSMDHDVDNFIAACEARFHL